MWFGWEETTQLSIVVFFFRGTLPLPTSHTHKTHTHTVLVCFDSCSERGVRIAEHDRESLASRKYSQRAEWSERERERERGRFLQIGGVMH